MRLVGLTTLIVAASLALAAAAPGALTPSAYQAQANAICDQALNQDVALSRAGMTTAAQKTAYYTGLVRVFDGEYKALLALDPPASLAAAHRKALWADWYWLRALSKVAKLPAGGTVHDAASNAAWVSYSELYKQKSKAWAAAGAHHCAY
jgi:hypothetical protein